ncbi:phosphotransferase family enzyme [Jatrophihabitans sp. GAS493]|uniref:phosphotransferase family protein n=1 Tax=Jatrophihabitans sp. GAS493 TaxID=1907575 RepID=UPI000BBFC1FA|nr:phosphotransferase [Jatrophihabitans sp. GAS493]SOD72144.1 phosphotransferase family enzyme [Jatrophihabitans sp. GAS493]
MRKSGLTPSWLTDVLRGAGHRNVLVTDVSVTAVGTGQMADSYRVIPVYAGEPVDVPDSVVVKLTSEDQASIDTSREQGNYLREVRFYQQLAPTIATRVPGCLYADVSQSGDDFVLVMEDVGPAEQGDQISGCSLERCEVVVDEAARLHGPRWGDPALAQLPWLNINDQMYPLATTLLTAAFPVFCKQYDGILDSAVVDVGTRLIEQLPSFFELQRAMPWTLQHGDYRPDNVLFDIHGGAEPAAIVDWQTIVLGPGVLDVAYFVGGALTPPDRRKHEGELFDRYHQRLLEQGVDYPKARLWDDYRAATFWGYLVGMGASVAVKRTERGDAMFMSMIDRATQQILDLDALRTLTR